MSTWLRNFVREDDGASMVEYGLLLALIAVVAIAAVTTVGGKVGNTFNNTAAKL